jgi:hypothetical protein
VGGAGINAVSSSAQSRLVGMGVEHSGAGLEGGEMRDGGHFMAARGGSDMLMAVKDGGGQRNGFWGQAGVSWGVSESSGGSDGAVGAVS